MGLNAGLKCFNHQTALWNRMFLLHKIYNDTTKGLRETEMNMLEKERKKTSVKPYVWEGARWRTKYNVKKSRWHLN